MSKNEHRSSTRRSITSRSTSKKQRHRVEVSAGGLVIKRTPRGIYFAMLQDSFGNWTFPKGHVRRQRETYQQAAHREIEEELGLRKLKLIQPLGQIDIWFRDRFVFKGKLVHKFIHYFLFEVPDGSNLHKPEKKDDGEQIQDVAWVPVGQVISRSSYRDMKPIIKRALVVLDGGQENE
ncbi:MAG: NUDIX domain-containing protein [Patescibacteria group bacterium]